MRIFVEYYPKCKQAIPFIVGNDVLTFISSNMDKLVEVGLLMPFLARVNSAVRRKLHRPKCMHTKECSSSPTYGQ